MIRHVLVALCITLSPLPACAELALGRLFLTPEKRAVLERGRALKLQQTQPLEATHLSLEGIVRRSGGRSTVWINGRPRNVADRRDDLEVRLDSDPSSVQIHVADETPTRLRVGETMNRVKRETHDEVGNGRIVLRAGPGR